MRILPCRRCFRMAEIRLAARGIPAAIGAAVCRFCIRHFLRSGGISDITLQSARRMSARGDSVFGGSFAEARRARHADRAFHGVSADAAAPAEQNAVSPAAALRNAARIPFFAGQLPGRCVRKSDRNHADASRFFPHGLYHRGDSCRHGFVPFGAYQTDCGACGIWLYAAFGLRQSAILCGPRIQFARTDFCGRKRELHGGIARRRTRSAHSGRLRNSAAPRPVFRYRDGRLYRIVRGRTCSLPFGIGARNFRKRLVTAHRADHPHRAFRFQRDRDLSQ